MTHPLTLIDLLKRNAEACPDKPAFIHEKTLLSHDDLYRKAAALGRYLHGLGLERQDRVVMIVDRKTPDLVIAFLGIAAAGGIVVPIDSSQPPGYFNELLSLISPRAVILSAATISAYEATGISLPASRVLVTDAAGKTGYTPFSSITSDTGPPELPPVMIRPEDTVYFNLTSGTTGLPKCAVTSHEAIFWNTLSAVEQLNLTPDDIHLCMFPPSTHPHELFSRSLFLGGTSVLTNHLAPKSLSHDIESNQVTAMMAIAPIYGNLAKCHAKSGFTFSSLRMAESGGMHLDPVTARNFQERFNLPITPVWGSTETAGIALAMPLDRPYRRGSTGLACPYYEARVVAPDGTELPPFDVGELIVRGRGLASGYFRNPDETAGSFREDWYWTGDMFSRDEDGYFFFAGRSNGMMKVAGMKVFPIEIEDHLIEHPMIREVGVTKQEDPLYGEIPRAVIVLHEKDSLDKKQIRDYCSRKLAPYKIPKVIEFREALPRTPGGKILISQL